MGNPGQTEVDVTTYLDVRFNEAPMILRSAACVGCVVARVRNMSQLARDSYPTSEGPYKALSSDGNTSFGTALKAANAMGYRFALVRKNTRVGRSDR